MAKGLEWLGIGAQRSGTTWFASMLGQHPEVSFPTGGKELHELYSSFYRPWGADDRARYLDLFPGDGRRGEFTPYYLRALWAPGVARAVLRPDAPVLVILRDPVVRFESAIRHYIANGQFNPADMDKGRLRFVASDVTWGGMYAAQLEAWAKELGRHRLMVFQYEAVRRDPAAVVKAVWERLGLRPVALQDVEVPSWTTADHVDWSLDAVPGLREQLRRLYRPQMRSLRRWGIKKSLWVEIV